MAVLYYVTYEVALHYVTFIYRVPLHYVTFILVFLYYNFFLALISHLILAQYLYFMCYMS